MSTARIFLFVALVVFFGSNADAFVREFNDVGTPGNPVLVPVEWNKNRTVLMHVALPTFKLSDGSTLNDVAQEALNIWNQQLVHMQFAVDKGSILPPSQTD